MFLTEPARRRHRPAGSHSPRPRARRGPDPPGQRLRAFNLPFRSFAHNQVWLWLVMLAQDLIAWTAQLCLADAARAWEPKRLRYRLLHQSGRIAHHARRTILRLARDWPCVRRNEIRRRPFRSVRWLSITPIDNDKYDNRRASRRVVARATVTHGRTSTLARHWFSVNLLPGRQFAPGTSACRLCHTSTPRQCSSVTRAIPKSPCNSISLGKTRIQFIGSS